MLNGLRLRLTLLYLLAALGLVVLIGGGTYRLLGYYFATTTDLALKHKMAHELQALDATVPPELVAADTAWYANRTRFLPRVAATPTPSPISDDEEQREHGTETHDDDLAEEAYDGELAAIFTLPLDAQLNVLSDVNTDVLPLPPQRDAASIARSTGSDLRSVLTPNGAGVRLLSYRVDGANGPVVLQLGRTLTDQAHILRQLLMGLLGVGSSSALVFAAASWWLAGRSLRPAQEAWVRQQAFVANASHELRTPLTLLRASAEVALRRTSSNQPDQRDLLSDVLHECDHMTQLVEELLLLSRLDAGRLVLTMQAVPVAELAAEVVRQTGRLGVERSVHIVADHAAGVALADPLRLRQVLLILIDNALHHTPAGGTIEITATPQPRAVQMSVCDTGTGIASKHLPHIFDRFYQADSARNDERLGSGLGLSIAKAIIDAHGGRIWADSQLGHGTRIWVVLPAATPLHARRTSAVEDAKGTG